MTFQKIFLHTIQQKVQRSASKKDYSIGFYTGGVDVSNWKDLSKNERSEALSQDWYIWWKYRNPNSGKLKRFPNIKKGVNRLKTMQDRIAFMKNYKKAMIETFEEGSNPFSISEEVSESKNMTAAKALQHALDVKKEIVSERTYNDYRLTVNEFKEFLSSNKKLRIDISLITRKTVTEFLNIVLKRTSVRRRNNTRGDLSSLFTVLSEEFIIETNFIKTDIPKLKSQSISNPIFTLSEMKKLSAAMKEDGGYIALYSKVACYMHMRSVEVARLKIRDLDFVNKEIKFQQKTKATKSKRIPDILFNELKSYANGYDDYFTLFTPIGKPGTWNASEVNKRNYHGKRLKKIKNSVGIIDDRGFHSMRHFYITESYVKLRKSGLNEDDAIKKLSDISGHMSSSGIKNYIHYYDIEKPEDWSDLFDFKL